ncbi:hypothetical protein [Pseudomonas sp. LP_7_YM]|uniref:hypothetical protein n=1 Tax=Pseudomonas sp. LP_7_YM TaxID=2485137 RepID=UPI0010F0B770|nr:hypothetical protein [Pseudomonas sp. LP_7_YM]TDV62596.1 hypothetical protein EC915_107182 [Pseudomonas sp. LP_7_YM]
MTRPDGDMHSQEFSSRSYPIQEDMAQQRKAWRFERIGWVGLILLIGLTLAGLFSKGPLSQVEPATADGRLQVKYERFSRNGAQDDLIITSKGAAYEILYLVLGSELLEGVSIEGLNPQPEPLRSEGRDLVIPMKADRNGLATLYLTVRSNGVGLYRGSMHLIGGENLPVPKFIYP